MTERGELRVSVAALAVAMAALAVYALALGNDFAYDDVPILLGDPRLRAPLGLRAIFAGGYWQNSDLALYRPITTWTFALDWALAPASPAWFHLSNVVLHAGASVLAFLLLTRLFPTIPALMGGLVFAVHPAHVEAVVNVVGRAELLAALFMFGACLLWLRETRWRWFAAALFALALLSKESAIMLPALLVLLDGAAGSRFSGGIGGYLRREGLHLLVLGLVAALYLVLRVSVLGALAPGRVDPVLEMAGSSSARILTALQAWPEYARLFFIPVTLLADYGPRILLPANGLTGAGLSGLALVAITVVGGCVALGTGARRTGLGLLWFPVAILPISNLLVPIGVLVAERTLYVPLFALSMGAGGLTLAAARATAPVRRAAPLFAAALSALLAGRSILRIPDWENTDAIMAAQVRDRPDSFRGHWHGARFMRANGNPAAAAAGYDRALALWPHRQALVAEAAAYAVEQGRTERAVELANLLVIEWPDDAAGYRMLAGFALDAGDTAAAGHAITGGLQRAPLDPILRQMAAALDSIRTGSR